MSRGVLKSLDDLQLGSRVCLYGTGRGCNIFRALLRHLRTDVEIVCLIDSFKTGEKDGLKIISPYDISENSADFDIILITSGFWRDIEKILSTLQITNYMIVDASLLSDVPVTIYDNDGALRHPVYRGLFTELWNMGDDEGIVKGLLAEMETKGVVLDRYHALIQLLQSHPAPHHVNTLLCSEEIREGIDEVKSFPTDVYLDISSVCNIRCRFCKCKAGMFPVEMVTLKQVQEIDWFKYIKVFAFYGGTAESLTNPEFLDIFNYVHDRYPHLHSILYTNGVGLNRKILTALAGKITNLHVSMNASNKKDYDTVIKNGNWKLFSDNMTAMAEIMKDRDKPFISASFVMMRWNLDSALECLEFARAAGASLVGLNHYVSGHTLKYHKDNSVVLNEKFSKENSLYYDKERSDRVFEKVRKRAEALGIQLVSPLPFNREDYFIDYSVRTLSRPSEICGNPWTHMYLRWGNISRKKEVWFCCAMAMDMGAFYDTNEILKAEGLMKVRNSSILRAYRKTVNGTNINPICTYCRHQDRFDPDSVYPPDQREFFEFNNMPVPQHLMP
ncbi:Fe-S oxidoreductase [Candidatus Magnetobacterium bavaricum]|uniref:Fe-S oxidoreductase n=1 Tax=Candidatus Magnetobacterium bavaricum TaxID=29290 RepID=A0A0F3GPM0_9BACT|nr:Fe-S oxidoreductase [Candidatus Magnetobacterium bavaricum]